MYYLRLNISLIRVLIRKLHRKTRIVRWNSSDIKMDLKCDEDKRQTFNSACGIYVFTAINI
jgi:hypothetical protein